MAARRNAASRENLDRQRLKDAGRYDSDQEDHLQAVHSAQRGDISLGGKKSSIPDSIKSLVSKYEPLSRLGKKR
jgi:hypothetical protein